MPLGCGIGVGTPFMQSSGVPLPPFPWTPDFTPFQFEVAPNATGNGGSGNNTIRLPFRPIVLLNKLALQQVGQLMLIGEMVKQLHTHLFLLQILK